METSRKRQALDSTAAWATVRDQFMATGNAAAAQRALSDIVDAIVIEAFQSSISGAFPDVALLAVGALGRKELFPYSEIDLVIVHDGEPPAGLKDAHSQLAALLRESGLRPSQRLCTIDECLQFRQGAIDLQVNLLDRRFLSGHAGVAARLDSRMAEFLRDNGRRLAGRLIELARARHEKYQNTPYHGRPDVKEAPGGIRDIHLLARLHKLGVEAAAPGEEFGRAAEYIAAVRFRLHYEASGDRNVIHAPPAEYFSHARVVFAAVKQEPPPTAADLPAVISRPDAAKVLRSLRDAGLLERMVPGWSAIDGRIDPHADHPFTEGEQALITLEKIAELRDSADPSRQRFRELLTEIDDPAALMNDLLLREAPQPDLSAAGGRAHDIAERVGTIERLTSLTLSTYARIAASHPQSTVPWRLDQLWNTYSIARRALTRELETERITTLPEDLASGAGLIRGFPMRYLRTRSAAEIRNHLQLYEQSLPAGVAVQIERIEGAYKLTVVARDVPFLFASFAGALTSFGLDILKAEAFGNSEGIVLDTFVFADPQRTLERNPPELERLEDLVRRVGVGKTDARRLLRNRAQPDPRKGSFAPQIRFDSEAYESATLVEIVAEDRPGLLYSLAMVFSTAGCNIDVVLIDTKGQRAIDVFYVSHAGAKLSGAMQETLTRQLEAAC